MGKSDTPSFPNRKVCPDCGIEKPRSEFRRNKARPDGLSFYCKKCFAQRDKEGYRKRQEKKGRTVRQHVAVPHGFKRCPGCETIKPHEEWSRNRGSKDGYASYCKACYSKRGARDYLKRTYQLTPEEVRELATSQGGVCRICQAAPAMHIDHDHDDGAIRGMLCFRCNAGIGQFADDPERLRRAAGYLGGTLEPERRWTQPDPAQPVYVLVMDDDTEIRLSADYAHA